MVPRITGASSHFLAYDRVTGDKALAHRSSETVLREAASGLAAGIEAGDYLAFGVHYLALGVNPQTRARLVHDRGCPSSVERRLSDFVHGFRFAKVVIAAAIYKIV